MTAERQNGKLKQSGDEGAEGVEMSTMVHARKALMGAGRGGRLWGRVWEGDAQGGGRAHGSASGAAGRRTSVHPCQGLHQAEGRRQLPV